MAENSRTPSVISSTSKMSFAVAGCAFGAALVGVLINQWMSGWMAVGGMVGLGLFYLAIAVLNLKTHDPIYEEDRDLTETVAHRLSGAANVDDRAINRRPEVAPESLAKTRN